MILASSELVTQTAYMMLSVFAVALVLSFIRLARGPSMPDRVVALDLIATLSVGVVALYAIATHEPVILRVAMIVALINFVGTIAFAYYLQRRARE